MRVPKNKIKVNDTYFNVIDTKEKSYMFGLFLADGCVWFDKQNKPHIQLKLKDLEGIESFKKAISSEHNIRKEKDGYRLVFRSRQMANDLITNGCTPKKSLTKKFPNIFDVDLLWSFIFGYIDGNGTISRRGNSVYIIIYTGSQEFASSLFGFYLSQGITPWAMKNPNNDNTHRVGVSAKQYILKIYQIWKENPKYISRKFDLLKKYIEECYGNTEVT